MVAFWPVFFLFNFGFLHASNFNIFLSRVFRWRICGRNSGVNSATVVPIERDFTAEESNTRLYPDLVADPTDNDHGNIHDLLALDPFDKDSLFDQLSKCKISKDDRLSSLCFDLMNFVTDYLDFDSNLNLRTVNQRFLINQIETSRFECYKAIRTRIISGFGSCQKSTLSASYFNQLDRPLHHLLSKSTRLISRYYYCSRPDDSVSRSVIDDVDELEDQLDEVTNFRDFLILATHFYRRTDLKSYWELVDVFLKIGFIDPSAFNNYIGFKVEDTFFRACLCGRLCIIKTLFRDPSVVARLDLFSGASTALTTGHFKVFKMIISKMKEHSFGERAISNLLEKSVLRNKNEFAHLLLETFAHLSLADSSILFLAIKNKNIRMTETIVGFKGASFIYECFYFNLCALELAAKYNFHEGVGYFLSIDGRMNLTLIASAIKIAIQYHATESLQVLINGIAGNSPLNEVCSKQAVSIFLSSTVTYRNIDAMKYILSRISLRHIDRLGLIFDTNLNSRILVCNVIHYAVQFQYEAGLETLINHFGIEALEETDGLGRTPFLLAVVNENLDFALKIAKLNPNSVKIPDLNGDTALHLMVSSVYPIHFIRAISALNLLNWDARNYALLSPLDILESSKQRLPGKHFDELTDFLLEVLK